MLMLAISAEEAVKDYAVILSLARNWEQLPIRKPGAIAQLAERLDRTQEVGGSNPPSSIAGSPCTWERVMADVTINRLDFSLKLRHLCLSFADYRRYTPITDLFRLGSRRQRS
jgi:hypothetical protein